MSTRKTQKLPARLRGVLERFERWRIARQGRARIPESLWASAVKMAGTYGVSRTARTLKVDYYSLKQRTEQLSAAESEAVEEEIEDGPSATFIELGPLAATGLCQCTLELENPGGVKMRVRLQSPETPDLALLSRSFLGLD